MARTRQNYPNQADLFSVLGVVRQRRRDEARAAGICEHRIVERATTLPPARPRAGRRVSGWCRNVPAPRPALPHGW